MAVTAAQLASLAPGVDPDLIQQHVARMDGRYFARFTPEEIAAHLSAISSFTADRPASVKVVVEASGEVACTVFAFDHPGAFSLIAGVLSSMGYNIRSGDIFTWAAPAPDTPRSIALRRRRIIDHFTGTVRSPVRRTEGGSTVWGGVVAAEGYHDDWQQTLENRLIEVFAGLERRGEAAAEARRAVNEMAARTLGESRLGRGPVLYPVQIEVEPQHGPAASGPERTRMRVISQDTPFFLFTFAAALTLQEVSIEHVTIRTTGERIEDEFEFVDAAGRAITDPARMDRIKLSVLLTKQFTSFLESAPDPLAALTRFEQLVKEVIATPSQGGEGRGTASTMTRDTASSWLELLSDRDVMRDLAQLLGASTFLWEDFVRSQYEELLPMLVPSVDGKGFVEPIELLPERLERALAGAADEEDFARRLNDFKDREIYLFDLDHILNARDATDAEAFGSDFLTLSRRLTALAENVVEAAAAFAWRGLSARFGEPRTVAGLPVRYAIMGLGKMGGVALGYASDIELLFVYSDSGSTAGPERIDNSEFFDRLVREVLRLVHAKREGIFHIDLRLRPFGAAGPLGCSLESFCTYYARGGPAHSYERLSLVRLRGIGGERSFGRQVERLRDEMVYSAQSIDMAEVRSLRARQVQEKSRPGALNAKFSPGALVDLEYAVQILQVMHGAAEKRLRTPRIHEALEALASIGVLEHSEAVELVRAYHFFRHLINGLRMLRGSAQDLFLPALDSDEYLHLARRLGYTPEPEITPAQKLHLDFETHTAEVRAFVERHFGRESLSGGPAVTVADIVLSDAVPEDQARATLSERGFSDTARALLNLRHIGGEAERRTLFARLAILACDILAQRPDPDMALNNWERFLHALDDQIGRASCRERVSLHV
jgi:[glutamine synthetase] adenylyltransferase / [glutamine synthetase]-adenylyl-L-tyrosine phosphorylase